MTILPLQQPDATVDYVTGLLGGKMEGGSGKAWCPVHQPELFQNPPANGARGGNLAILPPDRDGYPTFECNSRNCRWSEMRPLLAQKVPAAYLRPLPGSDNGQAEVLLPTPDALQEWQELLFSKEGRKRQVSKPFLEYLIKEIGLSRAQIKELRLGRQREFHSQGFRDLLVIPVFSAEGQLRNVVRFDPTGQAWGGVKRVWPGTHPNQHLLGADRVAEYPERVVLVEGITDFLAGVAHKVPVVATIAGAAAHLSGDVEVLAGRETVVLFDNDTAGRNGAEKAVQSVHAVGGVPFVGSFAALAPERGGDLRDALRDHSPDAVMGLVASAPRYDPTEPSQEGIEQEIRRQKQRSAARHLMDSEGWHRPPFSGSIKEQFDKGVEPVEPLIDGWIDIGDSALVIATYKAGKTTFGLNIARSLCDETKFLGVYDTHLPEGNVGFWNMEVSKSRAHEWIKRMEFEQPERFFVEHLKGFYIDLMVPTHREWAVEWLRDQDIKVWIIDPKSRVYKGEENDNTELGRWLETLDESAREAGVHTVILIDHTPHSSGVDEIRARGASRLMGWAEVFLRYEVSGGTRYLSSEGRGENDQPSTALNFDKPTKTLTVNTSSRGKTADALVRGAQRVFDAINQEEGLTSNGIAEAIGASKRDVPKWTKEAISQGWVRVEDGPNNSKLHFKGEKSPYFKRNLQQEESGGTQ